MPMALITLDDSQSDVDELSGAAPMFLNMLVVGDKRGQRPIRTRPGIREWTEPTSFPSTDPVTAMTVIDGSTLVYVTDNGFGTRRVFTWTSGAVTACSTDGVAESFVDGEDPVSLVPARNLAIAVGGGSAQLVGLGISNRLAGSPPQAVDAALIAQRLVLVHRGPDGLFFWSDVADFFTWDTLFEFAEAEARPDKLLGCREFARELYMFGANTTQVFVPDESQVFAPVATLETGCLSRGSIVRSDTSMAWLDDRRRIVQAAGRGVVALSDLGIASTLETLANPTDVWAFRAKIGNHDLRTWCFWKDGRAFSFDDVSQTWSEWRRWADGRWQSWAPRSHVWWPEKRVHLLGMPDGTVAEMSLDAHSDLDDDLRWQVRTGFRVAEGRRHCVEARFPFRPGEATNDTSAVAVAWRDDAGAFCSPIESSLGAAGDTDPDLVVSPAGEPYRRRQWEITGSGADAYTLMPGTEIYEVCEF